ncbi:MAG TPA: hypothetical protein PK698_07330 [Bacilli bacterium]|nr:hypothetical protein [Bacilli bacterium]
MNLRKILIILLSFVFTDAIGQINLTIEGIDSITTTHNGYDIPRTSQTNLIFRYNRIRTALDDGFMLTAGDNDYSTITSTKLNGAQIYGNRFNSTNTSPSGSLHGIMAGYNKNYDFHHNYISTYSYGFTHEGGYPDHTSMESTSGGVYYNIFKNNSLSINEKGYDGTRIVNNTFFVDNSTWAAIITLCNSNTGGLTEPYPPTKNVIIKNNIFYVRGTGVVHALYIVNEEDTLGLDCDYNIYFYENRTNNEPLFNYMGANVTWSQWRALGYDQHSIILNPDFIDINEFVPRTRINFGCVIFGLDVGLSAENSVWAVGQMPATNTQGSSWQPGARIYQTPTGGDFFVSPDGNDNNPGTYTQPWATWGKAFNSTAVQPGDTVYFRGGVYQMTSNNLAYPGTLGEGYDVSRDGTSGNYIHYFNYPGEKPILDCSNVTPVGSHNIGIYGHDVNYVHFKGLTVRNAYQIDGNTSVTGWGIVGNNNIIENCVVYNCGGKGFFGAGHNIYYINCDAYNNSDSLTYEMPGNDGVGFTNVDVSQDDGSVYYINCRAWENGDQGFSAISNGYLEFNGCWSFNNGDLQGEGHGFKMGCVGIYPNQPDFGPLKRKYVNCIAAYNRANGWTTNDSDGSTRHQEVHRMHIYNNLSFFNGHHLSDPWPPMQYGFVIYKTASDASLELAREYYNNISIGNEDGEVFIHSYPHTNPVFASYTHSNNSWDGGATITLDDFAAVPVNKEAGVTLLMGTRQSDGSLPNLGNYFKLAQSSDAIDGGINVGLPYKGTAPDLGPFESDYNVLQDGDTKPIIFINKPIYFDGTIVIIK